MILVELQQMLFKENCNLADLENGRFSQPWLIKQDSDIEPNLSRHLGSGSGGYCDHIFRFAAKELFGIEVDILEYRNLRFL